LKLGIIKIDFPLRNIRFREENGQYEYDINLSIKVENVETKSSYQEKKEKKDSLSLENLKRHIKEGYSLRETIRIPLEKGTNKIYFSLRDTIQQKRLRKLDIIKIK